MDYQPIPGPRGLPVLGNLLDVRDEEASLRALEHLADIYGPIYKVTLAGGKRNLVVSSAELMKEVMDEKRFMKIAIGSLHDDRADGLIVAATLDPDWEQAHRILRPAFGPLKVEDMFDDMKDIAHQFVMKWARFGSEEEIAITEDFSNLTLDTIALCTMAYRFNSFYREGMHPFIAAMITQLESASTSQGRIPIVSSALAYLGAGSSGPTKEQVAQANDFMRAEAQRIIDQRRDSSESKNDFLNILLFGKDPKTGESMRDELIAAQMQTFLKAGHETTSGLLSFAVMYLLQNPETYRKAQQEVDRIVGHDAVTLRHIRDCTYVYAVLQETLRLVPTAPIIFKIPHPKLPREQMTLGKQYKLEPNDRVRILLGKCMQDPTFFGEDAREFRPERMLESNPAYETLEKYWRPFSEGSRACLGRPFALQEAMLAMILMLQNFDMRLTNPMYKMRIKQNITIKPMGLSIKASLRDNMTPLDLERRLHNGDSGVQEKKATEQHADITAGHQRGPLLRILYGTNTGTCQALAQRLASEAASRFGFTPDVEDMDTAVGNVSKEALVVLITSSYEGEPPDNALQFVKYLESLKGNELEGIQYATFGCGNRDWHATFHRIPRLINATFNERGAKAIAELGLSDVSQGNPMADFETWLDTQLLPELKKLSPRSEDTSTDIAAPVQADVSTGDRVALLRQDLRVGTVKYVEVLTVLGEQPEKRHMEIELPPESSYECGDYLAVLPQSPEASVRAVMSHFKLPHDATIVLRSKIFTPLPLNVSLSVADVLKNYYELARPATRRALALALKHTKDASVEAEISSWLESEEQFRSHVTDSKMSVFDLLHTYPDIAMPFPDFLSLLPPLNIRQYSISSSPLRNPDTCTITYSVVTDKRSSNLPLYGVATTYLSTLKPGDKLQVATRRTAKQSFRLPLDAEKTPLLMFAAGTGLAPFRGFIEQRATQLEANPNTKLAPAYLFLGCRSAVRDRLYADQMDHWVQLGAVSVYYAYSREPEHSEGCKYVAERMLLEMETISTAWLAGARAYTCGNRAFAQNVQHAATDIVQKRLEDRKAEGWSSEMVEERKASIFESFGERASDDVFD